MRILKKYLLLNYIVTLLLLSASCNTNIPTPPVKVSDEQLDEVMNLLTGTEEAKNWFLYLETDTIVTVEDSSDVQSVDIVEYHDTLNSPIYSFTKNEIKIGILNDGVLDNDHCTRIRYELSGDEQGRIIVNFDGNILPEKGYLPSDFFEIVAVSADSLRLRRYFSNTSETQHSPISTKIKNLYFVAGDFKPIDNTPTEVDDEISRDIIMKLTNSSNKEWYLCLKTDTITSYYQDGNAEKSNRTWSYNLTSSVQLWMIYNSTIKEGRGSHGVADYSTQMTYSIRKNKEGAYFINTLNEDGKEMLYQIVSVENDSMHLVSYTYRDISGSIYSSSETKTDYYWCAYDYSSLAEKKENTDIMIVGEWLLVRSQTIIDYIDGFTSPQGLTHTDSTIVYSSEYPYLRIDDNSVYALGKYVDGNVYLSPTPADVGINNARQTYFTHINDDGDIQIHFSNFFIRYKDSKYVASDNILVVERVTSDSLITHRNIYLSGMGMVDGVLSIINVGKGATYEQWTRKK